MHSARRSRRRFAAAEGSQADQLLRRSRPQGRGDRSAATDNGYPWVVLPNGIRSDRALPRAQFIELPDLMQADMRLSQAGQKPRCQYNKLRGIVTQRTKGQFNVSQRSRQPPGHAPPDCFDRTFGDSNGLELVMLNEVIEYIRRHREHTRQFGMFLRHIKSIQSVEVYKVISAPDEAPFPTGTRLARTGFSGLHKDHPGAKLSKVRTPDNQVFGAFDINLQEVDCVFRILAEPSESLRVGTSVG
jgi:hypothetical protein